MNQKILLIEDNVEMAENIAGLLQLAHYDVVHAPNGKIGVDLARQIRPDLILCDIVMPEMDGYGVMSTLQKDAEMARTPFVFLTSKADKADIRTGMDLGADDYITKPFEGIDLLKVVDMRLKKNALLKTVFANTAHDVNNFLSKIRDLKDFRKLSADRPVRTYKRKDLIFMEGQTPNDLFFIESGCVKTYKVNYDGKELITGIHREGAFLGFVSLLEEKPYNETAEVLENARVSTIPKSDFLTLIYSNQDVARVFIRMLSNNIAEMENRLMDVAYQSVRQRVAKALLKIGDSFTNGSRNGVIGIARRDISNIVGTATESLNRTLSDFRDEGLIAISTAGIKVLDRTRLQKLVH